MPDSKKNARTPPPQGKASKTSQLFAPSKTPVRGPITRERLAADLEAFRRAGGKIEVMGITRSLHRIDADAKAGAVPAPAPKTAPSNPRR